MSGGGEWVEHRLLTLLVLVLHLLGHLLRRHSDWGRWRRGLLLKELHKQLGERLETTITIVFKCYILFCL